MITFPIWVIATLVYIFVAFIINSNAGGMYDFGTPMIMVMWTLIYLGFWIWQITYWIMKK